MSTRFPPHPLIISEPLFYNLPLPKSTSRLLVFKSCPAPLIQPSPSRRGRQWRGAGRALNLIERHQGPFDTTPLTTTGTYTERWRVQHRLLIGMPVPWCRHCQRSYLETLPGASEQYCSSTCSKAD